MTTRTAGRGSRAGAPTIDIYARISRSDDGTRGRSVSEQVDDGIAAIEARGATVGEVFRDESLSAWSPKVHRPEFDRLMTRLESGRSQGVWVRELTRFSRKIMEGERLVQMADRGVLVWSADDEYDLTRAAGRRHFRDDMVTAANESDTISERTTRGKEKRARRGRSNATHRGFARPGYLPKPPGWQAGDIRTPVPEEQLAGEIAAVRQVAEAILAGGTWAEAARWVNERGHTTYQGKAWSAEGLRQMMEAPSLAGVAEHKGQRLGVLPGEPVLDLETWERVQSVIAARRPGRPHTTRYLLSGVLFCGACGFRMAGRPVGPRAPYDDGSPAREYRCAKRSAPVTGCGQVAVDQRFADDVVKRATLKLLSDPDHADQRAATEAVLADARADIAAERERLNTDADALAEKTLQWGAARVDKAMGPILARLAALTEAEASLATPDGPTVAPADVAEVWDHPDTTTAERRRLVRQAFPDGIPVAPASSRGISARLDDGRFGFGDQ